MKKSIIAITFAVFANNAHADFTVSLFDFEPAKSQMIASPYHNEIISGSRATSEDIMKSWPFVKKPLHHVVAISAALPAAAHKIRIKCSSYFREWSWNFDGKRWFYDESDAIVLLGNNDTFIDIEAPQDNQEHTFSVVFDKEFNETFIAKNKGMIEFLVFDKDGNVLSTKSAPYVFHPKVLGNFHVDVDSDKFKPGYILKTFESSDYSAVRTNESEIKMSDAISRITTRKGDYFSKGVKGYTEIQAGLVIQSPGIVQIALMRVDSQSEAVGPEFIFGERPDIVVENGNVEKNAMEIFSFNAIEEGIYPVALTFEAERKIEYDIAILVKMPSDSVLRQLTAQETVIRK